MTIAQVLAANIEKLGNLKIPAKEADLFNGINEVAHDIQVCYDAIVQAEAKAKKPDNNEEAPEDETDTE